MRRDVVGTNEQYLPVGPRKLLSGVPYCGMFNSENLRTTDKISISDFWY